mgnify:CR=1 FL=1
MHVAKPTKKVYMQHIEIVCFSFNVFALLRREGVVMKRPEGWVSVSDEGVWEILSIWHQCLIKKASGQFPDYSPRCA